MLYGAFGTKCVGHRTGSRPMLLLLFDTPFPGLIQHYNWYGVIVLPFGFQMVSSFKREQFHCGEPRVKEALVLLNWHLG